MESTICKPKPFLLVHFQDNGVVAYYIDVSKMALQVPGI